YRLGLLNGTRGTLAHIDTRRQEMTLTGPDQQRTLVPFDYAAAGHLTHGYATTIHKAQGATIDRCFILADDTPNREHAYTALSRGRHSNDLFMLGATPRVEERHAAEVDFDPLHAARRVFARSTGKTLATDQAVPPTDLARLHRERHDLRR